MTVSSASGERAALGGYRWQYDQIADRVYDALFDRDFVSLRLTDPDAGRIDDMVLVRSGRTDAFQFRSSRGSGPLTFSQVTDQQTNRSGKRIPSLAESLANCWRNPKLGSDPTHVHLVTTRQASTRDRVGDFNDPSRPVSGNFRSFLAQVLEPIRSGTLSLTDVDTGWAQALDRLRRATGLPAEEFERFLTYLHIEVGIPRDLPKPVYNRQRDVRSLSDALYRKVSESSDVVVLNEKSLLQLMGWQNRPSLRNRHEFPVDEKTYAPLQAAIDELDGLLAAHDRGYVGVVGPPGAGKSTLLNRALSSSPDHVIRYFAYVPRTAPTRTRLTARGFLHDMLVMLRKEGIEGQERALPSDDLIILRKQFADLLDASGERFRATGRRTIIIVDGLDHVDREYEGNDDLVAELPRPDGIPNGVLLLLGSRNLDSLNDPAQQQMADREAIVDLQNHRLSPASVLDICRRAPSTAKLSTETHGRIAELSDGYPLALGYILNRLHESGGDEDAETVLAGVPRYEGDIAAEYRGVWRTLEQNYDIVGILYVCSRLRIGFSTEWLLSWAPESAVRDFLRSCRYLFRVHPNNKWQFFHDSFRQYASERTCLTDDTFPKERAEALAHQRAAELCAQADVPEIAAEELYHRYCAGDYDRVLVLADQKRFRAQRQDWRSPSLLRQDIECALGLAADRGDVLSLFGLLLALVEATETASMLDEVDVPGTLFEAGLVEQAIEYAGIENRQVPLGQTYNLASKLGRIGHSAGSLLFDSVAHHGLDEPDIFRSGSDPDDVAKAWAAASLWFRPIQSTLSAIRGVFDPLSRDVASGDLWGRVVAMFLSLLTEVQVKGDKPALGAIDAALRDHAKTLQGELPRLEGDEHAEWTKELLQRRLSEVADLRVRLHEAYLALGTNGDTSEVRFEELLSMVRSTPLHSSTTVRVAELFGHYGNHDKARDILDQLPYAEPMSFSALEGFDEDFLDSCFRYWRLVYLIDEGVGLNQIVTRGMVSSTGQADSRTQILFAKRMDVAVRNLSWLDARIRLGHAVPGHEAWAALLPGIDLFRPTAGSDLRWAANRVQELIKIVVDVAIAYGNNLPQRLSDALENRFQDLPPYWCLALRVDIAGQLDIAGANVSWYEETLETHEQKIANEDVHSRLQSMAELVETCANAGKQQTSQRLAKSLVQMGFGVGWREDTQFDSWLVFLGHALANPNRACLIKEATWFARLLTAIAAETPNAIGSAADDLPSAIVPNSPLVAVRVFEYLVRQGTVAHSHALASLVAGLLAHLRISDAGLIVWAADITSEIIAPTTTRAYPELAQSFVKAAKRALGTKEAATLATAVAGRTDIYALPTTRMDWQKSFGVEVGDQEPHHSRPVSDPYDYGALVLTDGQRISRGDVAPLIQTVEDIIGFRSFESSDSQFAWDDLIRPRTLSNDNIHALCEAFADESKRSLRVIASLAEAAEKNGDTGTALRLASDVMEKAEGGEWLAPFGGAKPRAATVAMRLGGREARIRACRDLADQAIGNRWVRSQLTSCLPSIIEAVGSDLDPELLWEPVRVYLEGIAETLSLPSSDVLTDHGCRWWLSDETNDKRRPSTKNTPGVALAELVVGHLSHPTWVFRNGATTLVIRGLQRTVAEVAEALARFALPESSDDTLERAGRCLGAVLLDESYVMPAVLKPLRATLASHPSQIIRDLVPGNRPNSSRSLPKVYGLSLLPTEGRSLRTKVSLDPFDRQYRILADYSGISLATLRGVASQYATDALATLPSEKAIKSAMLSGNMNHAYPQPFVNIAAARAAFGRVLADLADANRLPNLPEDLQSLLRTVDMGLLGRRPQHRPSVIPPPMSPDLELTDDRWRSGVENRLAEYIAASTTEDRVLIGAKGRLSVLKVGQLVEELVFGTTIGKDAPRSDDVLRNSPCKVLNDLFVTPGIARTATGEPLVIAALGDVFNQSEACWLAFCPNIAATLGWVPEPTQPGTWITAEGHLAAESKWWMDGQWGRGDTASDDTAAEGHAVVITALGLADLENAFGHTTRHFALTRGVYSEGGLANTVSATRSFHTKA